MKGHPPRKHFPAGDIKSDPYLIEAEIAARKQ